MAFRPAGAEDSDSDEEGFFLGNSYDKYTQNGVNTTSDLPKKFSAMPAGEEYDDDDDGFEFGAGNSVSSQVQNRSGQKSEKQSGRMNESHSNSPGNGVGRGRGMFQQKGRGRGGFPLPPSSVNNKGKTLKRNHFSPNKSKQPETRRVLVPLVGDDFRVAVVKGNITAVQKFLDDGIDVDVLLKSGWTPLMLAASVASPEVVELLTKNGANVNFHKEMYTVLMATCAAAGSTPEEHVLRSVELLLERNARINVYDKYRMSPLMYAAREGRVTVCEKLLEHNAEINKQDMRGWTSLSWAASRGHGRVVRILLDKGADPTIYSNDGQTPSDIAYSSEYPRIADILSLAASGNQITPEAATQLLTRDVEKVESSSAVSYGDLEMFLCGLELTHLLPKFQEHKLTFEEFLKLTEKDLDQMGIIQVGIRTKILDSIRDVHKKDWEVSGLQSMEKHALKAPEVTVVLANVSKHLTFVRSSVSYVQKHLNAISEPLEFVQDVTEAEGMGLFSKEAAEAAQSLSEELNSLKTQICVINSKVSKTAPDLITDVKEPSAPPSSRRGLMLMTVVATVAVGALVIHKAWHNT